MMTASVFAANRDDEFATFNIEAEFVGRIVGGQPRDPKLVEGWIAKGMGLEGEVKRQQLLKHFTEMGVDISGEPTNAEIMAAVEATAGATDTQGFKVDETGRPCVEARHVKAMLKESANIVFPPGVHKFGTYESKSKERAGKMVGGKSAKAFVAERVFIEPGLIVLADEISGVELSVGHIPDFKAEGGKRSHIGYYEYVEDATISFTVLAHDDCLTDEQWAKIWTHAELNGLGALRSQSYGQFRVTKWERQ